MPTLKKAVFVSVVFGAAITAGCSQPSNPAQAVDTTNSTAPVAHSEPASPKTDPVSPDDLKAGLEAITPRVLKTVDAFSKIEPLPTSRYFMHPQLDKAATIEIDTTGLASLTLSPYIADLSPNPDCLNDSEAGIVEFSWALDDAQPKKLLVDRNYQDLINIEVGSAQKLSLSVDSGNANITCDWFSLGLLNVRPK